MFQPGRHQAKPFSLAPRSRIGKQVFNRMGYPAVPVRKLIPNPAQLAIGARRSDPFVGPQSLAHIRNVLVRNAHLYSKIELGRDLLFDLFTTQFRDRPFQHLAIEVKPYGIDVTRLLTAEKTSGTVVRDRALRYGTRLRDLKIHESRPGGVARLASAPVQPE